MKALFLSIILIMLPCRAFATNLFDLYNGAVANDPKYIAAIKDLEAGLENENIGLSSLLPKVNFSYYKAYNYAKQWGSMYSGGPYGTYQNNYPSDYTGVFLNQPIFSLEAWSRWQQGKAQALTANYQFMNDTYDLLIRVSTLYFECVLAHYDIQLKTAELSYYKEKKLAEELSFRRGEGVKQDYYKSIAEYDVAIDGLNKANADYEDKLFKLSNLVIGSNRGTIQNLTKIVRRPKFFILKSTEYSYWEENAREHNPAILLYSSRAESAKYEYKKANSGHYPTFSLVGAVTTQNSNTVTSISQTTNQSYVGVQLNMPLISGGEIASKSRQTYAQYEKALAEYDDNRNNVYFDLKKALSNVVRSESRIRAKVANLESAEVFVKSSEARHKHGEGIRLDILKSKSELEFAKRELVSDTNEYYLSYLNLLRLSGQLSIDDLVTVSRFY